MDIGQTIKKLRKERNFTQEELAEQLNVTPQAVSRWENGTGLPDISQLAPLTSVFGVSADVLLGTAGTSDDEEVKKIIAAIEERERNATKWHDEHDEPVVMLESYYAYLDALKTYPNNMALLESSIGNTVNIAGDYYWLKDERAAEFYAEGVREANLIINYSKDVSQIMRAHMWLVRLYSDSGEFDKAEKHANMFPEGYDLTRGAQLAWVKRAIGNVSGNRDEEIKQRCDNIRELLSTLEFEIMPLGNAYASKGQPEDALRCDETLYGIIDAVYRGEEYTPPMHVMWRPNIAWQHFKLGNTDAAFAWLERCVNHKIGQGKHYNKRKHIETPLLRECEFEFYGTVYDVKSEVLEELNREMFDPMRDDPRFVAVLERVNALE
ncbi:MAG: helix-turn-helix domain-containing protein [Oscillospiraceae bacterium]|jgi:transcriptional regulator with XRE-family HTH domain|nr:helix-turn-helix domain-containing protein [Oscillospiraceae bacterium]